jgi:hypothetical protein
MMRTNEAWYIAESGGSGNGKSIVDYSSFIGYQHSNQSSIPTKPVERGAFTSINKWSNPYEVDVEIAKHGTADEIADFLETLEKWRDSVDLVDVVTPSRVFLRANIYRINYTWNMDDTGPRLIIPKIGIREIRFVQSSASSTVISNPKNPGSTSTKNCGETSCSSVAAMPKGANE